MNHLNVNHLNVNKTTHGAVGALLATAVTAFFAAGIASGIATPHLAPLDPVALTWGYADTPFASRTGA
jgi:hypothetical protein